VRIAELAPVFVVRRRGRRVACQAVGVPRDLVVPDPRTPDPADAPPLRWGVVAPGHIAAQTVGALRAHTRQDVVAVASRDPERGAAFAARFGIDRVHPTYEALAADPGVDVVYVASPHSHHHEQARLLLEAGKHVLVEKAFTRNAAEARDLIALAQAQGVLLMEAMWTRYLPHTDVIRQLLDDGALGTVRQVVADYGVLSGPGRPQRLVDPALAGGALLDIGIYPVSFASFVARHAGLGASPASVQAAGSLTDTGVDAQISMQLGYGSAQAQLFTSIVAASGHTAHVLGDAGRVDVDARCYTPAGVTATIGDAVGHWDGNRIEGYGGLAFQCAALATAVAEGRRDSTLLPLAETVAILETTDEIRRQVGVRYPGE
jgi:predicted dehydrogenase